MVLAGRLFSTASRKTALSLLSTLYLFRPALALHCCTILTVDGGPGFKPRGSSNYILRRSLSSSGGSTSLLNMWRGAEGFHKRNPFSGTQRYGLDHGLAGSDRKQQGNASREDLDMSASSLSPGEQPGSAGYQQPPQGAPAPTQPHQGVHQQVNPTGVQQYPLQGVQTDYHQVATRLVGNEMHQQQTIHHRQSPPVASQPVYQPPPHQHLQALAFQEQTTDGGHGTVTDNGGVG